MTSDTITTPPAGDPAPEGGGATPASEITPPKKGWRQRRKERKARPVTRTRFIVRRVLVGLLALAAIAVVWFGFSFAPYVRGSQGEPTSVLLAEWGRDNHLGPIVANAENFYYDHFATVPVGGKPTGSAVVAQPSVSAPGVISPTPTPGVSTAPVVVHAHLNPPANITPPVTPIPDEGVWQPVGSKVDGLNAVYVTRVRPDAIHTSVLASMMWIDTKLTHTMLVPGYIEPGGPNPSNGALPKALWPSVLANFNGGFRLQDSRGGYYYQGTTVAPLVSGRATATFGKDGSINIGSWNRDFSMTPNTSVVLQNLDLIVDGGKSRVQPGDGFVWGATTHGENLAWRSAVGIRPDGSLVYIGSPGLSAETMADTLVKAGVVRAMVLDMNNWWVAGFYFDHDANGAPVCAKLDPNIAEGCDRFLNKYKRDSFQILAAP